MVEFILGYWREILEVVSIIVCLVIWIVRKPVTSSFDSDLISDLSVILPDWINAVEHPGDGESKKETVTRLALKYIRSKYGRSLTDDEIVLWTKRLSVLIENMLSTPQKKGVQ